jgi:hypothetical protein
MSANLNVTNADAKKRILLVAANPSTSKTTGWPIRFLWAELTHPYWVFSSTGHRRAGPMRSSAASKEDVS